MDDDREYEFLKEAPPTPLRASTVFSRETTCVMVASQSTQSALDKLQTTPLTDKQHVILVTSSQPIVGILEFVETTEEFVKGLESIASDKRAVGELVKTYLDTHRLPQFTFFSTK